MVVSSKRFRCFEWEDQPWFPSFLRRYMMDFLRFVLNEGNLYQPVTSLLLQGMRHTQSNHIIDLCSGAGGAILSVQKNISKTAGLQVSFTLTDLYPNTNAWQWLQKQSTNHIHYHTQPVNAAEVPAGLKGFRTMFSAFHHFSEPVAKQVLQNAANAGQGIAIFDGGSRSPWFIALIILFQPIAFLLFTPFIKPFSFGRLLFTYLLPIVPLCTVWDGVVSTLRLYPPAALHRLVQSIKTVQPYSWQTGTVKNRFGMRIAYIIGYPTPMGEGDGL